MFKLYREMGNTAITTALCSHIHIYTCMTCHNILRITLQCMVLKGIFQPLVPTSGIKILPALPLQKEKVRSAVFASFQLKWPVYRSLQFNLQNEEMLQVAFYFPIINPISNLFIILTENIVPHIHPISLLVILTSNADTPRLILQGL